MKLQTRNPLILFNDSLAKMRESLSAALVFEDTLLLAVDESTSVERLTTDDGRTFKHQRSFPLEDLITLPATGTKFDQEVDIEGMDFQDSHLWLIGSHSIKRKKVESGDTGSDEKLIAKLAQTESAGNRFTLARIPLIRNDSGEQELVKSGVGPTGENLRASSLPNSLTTNSLTEAIGKGDPHLARFLDIPGKDNGFDIEGLAVTAEKVFVGLRGPVVRGWAVVLELSIGTSDPSQLTLNNVGPAGRPYKKHFLDLRGLGVRDLCVHGEDLLVLAGPTMNLDGPTSIYRWKGAINNQNESLARREQLVQELEIQSGLRTDHAEGVTLISGEKEAPQILVVYDNPSANRKEGDNGVRADVFDLAST
jgi:hypothetical protein